MNSGSKSTTGASALEWLEAHALRVVLIVALLARLPTIFSRPLWYDEAFAVLFSAEGPQAMSYGTLLVEQGIAADVHPLGYYTLLWAWQAVAGGSPFSVRALSVILGLVLVYLGYRLSRKLFDERIANVAALALALSPFQVHYSQEVRMYALLAVLLLGATLALWRALEGDSLKYWMAFAVLGAAAQYTHTLAGLYLIPLGLTPLWRRQWSKLGKTTLAGLLATMLYLPWLVYLPSQLSRVRWAYWIPQPEPQVLVSTWLEFTHGLPVPQTLLAVVFVVLFGTVLATILGAWGTARGWRSKDPSFQNGIWLLYLAVFPVLFMFLISYWQAVYLVRALLTSGALFLLWLAWALSPPRLSDLFAWTGRVALLGTFALGLYSYYSYEGFPWAPWPRLNENLSLELQDQEIVLHSNKITALPARYYTQLIADTEQVADGSRKPELEHRYLPDPPRTASDTLAPATQEVLGFLAESNLEQAVRGEQGVWFIVFAREALDYLAEGYQEHPSLEWLSAQFTLESVTEYGELEVYHFVR